MKHLIVGTAMVFFSLTRVSAQENVNPQQPDYMVRLSSIVVDPDLLDEYNTFLKDEIEASMALEPGVVVLYAVAQKEHPNRITILEIYKNEEAYNNHIQTPHFIKYKESTLDMVQELELTDCAPLLPNFKLSIADE